MQTDGRTHLTQDLGSGQGVAMEGRLEAQGVEP